MSIIITAEIGINHNGDMSICKKLIDAAVDAGVDCVKFQKRDINLVYTKKYLKEKRQSPWGTTQMAQKKGLEFSFEEYKEIDDYCKKKKIDWFASSWDLNSLKFLGKFNLKFNKIASAMIVDRKLLEKTAEQQRYTFISTGMSTFKEIDKAVEIFDKKNCKFELMYAISAYPFEDSMADLILIPEMKKRYGCKVGYSGHEKGGLAISYAAVALGATSLERHITLDRNMYGSDQAASITTRTFRELIGGVRNIEKATRNKKIIKKILDIEKDVAKKLREHIK